MSKIEDYGDKIGGAKKDLFEGYLLKLSAEVNADPEFLRSLSLPEIFPKPDYVSMSEGGVPQECLAAICVARGSIGRKPSGRSATGPALRKWLGQIEGARTIALASLTPDTDERKSQMAEAAISIHGADMRRTFRVMKMVPAGNLSGAEGLSVIARRGIIYLVNQGGRALMSRPDVPGDEEAIEREIADVVIRNSGKEASSPTRRSPEERADLMMRKIRIFDLKDGKSIQLRTPGGKIVFRSGIKDLKEARAWFSENRPEIRGRIIASMQSFSERSGTMRERTGPSRRDGDVSAEMLANRFGLRGIEFGNYVEAARRQRDLNEMWDSFSDLAEALSIEPRAIGCDGALAVAFGARGGGHYAAHYERDRRVFNLTKSSGAGSAAHEWSHSADNAATMRNPSDKDERSLSMMTCLQGDEISALKRAWSGYEARMSELDAMRAKPYWSKPEEMFARSFEVWLVSRLKEMGIMNDHLVEIERSEAVYPTAEEMAEITPALKRFADAVMRKISVSIEPDREREMSADEIIAAMDDLLAETEIRDLEDDADEFTFGR